MVRLQSLGDGIFSGADGVRCDVQLSCERFSGCIQVVQVIAMGVEKGLDFLVRHGGEVLRCGGVGRGVGVGQGQSGASVAIALVHGDHCAGDRGVVIHQLCEFAGIHGCGVQVFVQHGVLYFGKEP